MKASPTKLFRRPDVGGASHNPGLLRSANGDGKQARQQPEVRTIGAVGLPWVHPRIDGDVRVEAVQLSRFLSHYARPLEAAGSGPERMP